MTSDAAVATSVFVEFVAIGVDDPAAELSPSVQVIATEGRVEEVVAICVRLIDALIRYNPVVVTAYNGVAPILAACAVRLTTDACIGRPVGN
jgi:hypothetical protein